MLYSSQWELSRAVRQIPHPGLLVSIILGLAFSFSLVLLSLRSKRKKPPVAVGSTPLLGHSLLFMRNAPKLAAVITQCGNVAIARFILPFQELWLVTQPKDIYPVLVNTKLFHKATMKSVTFEKILGVGKEMLQLVDADDSGYNSRPVPGKDDGTRSRRFNYVDHKLLHSLSSPASHTAFTKKFEENLYDWTDRCDITDEWTSFPDLYLFIRDAIFAVGTDAFFGPHLLAKNPGFAENFWTFNKNVPNFAKGVPALLNRQPVKARKNCIQAIVNWKSSALKNDVDLASLPEWDHRSGMKFNMLRKQAFNEFEELDEVACATADFGFLFGLNSNSPPATFWMMLELLQAPELSREISQEIASTRIQSDSSSPRFNTKKLLESSLLHSVYAETLRLYTAIMYLRKTRQEMEVGGWSIPKDQDLLVCSYSQHMNAQLWNPTGDPNYPSLETFWGHRFVINHESNTDDNVPIDEKTCLGDRPSKPPMQGVGQRWLPFGLGETMCPGRHIVKFEIVLSYAILNSIFEIEVLKPTGWRPEMDMSSFGYGTMAPKSQTPFRIRRRA